MQHYSSWEPKEFDKDAAQVEKGTDRSQANGNASLQDNGGYQYDQESGENFQKHLILSWKPKA